MVHFLSSASQWIGKPLKTKEGIRHVRGLGRFVEDISLPKMAYAALVRSPYAHARIKSIDISRAVKTPGVIAVLTGKDIASITQPFPQLTTPPASNVKDYSMAVNKVRYVGEPVAAVIAESRYAAADAAELVDVEYELLPAVVDPEEALKEDAPILHEEAGTNIAAVVDYDYGDYDEAEASADRIIRANLRYHRFSSTPLEPFAVLADYNKTEDSYTIYCNNQMPMFLIPSILRALNIGLDKIRIVTQDIGGGFGVKILSYPYMVLVAALSKLVGRPVKWVETRREHMMASSHGADRLFRVEAAIKNDGTLLGLKTETIDDIGAYARHEPAGLTVWAQVASGCCRFKHLRQRMYAVFTNKCPAGPNRGFARAPHQYMIERILDMIAREVGKDPVEVRLINYVKREEQPYTTLNGCVYDDGDYIGAVQRVMELLDYWGWRRRQEELRKEGRLIGIGIATTLDSGTANFGQVRMLNPRLPNVGTSEAASVQMTGDGRVVVKLGSVPQGQSHETVSAQIVADVLGMNPDHVTVAIGFDSESHPYTFHSGTYASRFAGTGMVAVYEAAMKLREKIRKIAAHLLEAREEDIELANEQAFVKDAPERSVSFRRIARTAYANPYELPEGMEAGLYSLSVFSPPFKPPDEKKVGNLTLTYSYQTHGIVVEIDPETGEPKILDYVIVDDCGRVINPLVVDGQIHGAALHGLAAVLYESFDYDSSGQLLTSTFMDYLAPTAFDTPSFKTERISIPSPFTPLGAKGVGEGCGTPIPALINAIEDALSPYNVRLTNSHIKPEEIYWIIRKSRQHT